MNGAANPMPAADPMPAQKKKSSRKSKHFYAVYKGRSEGIFDNWPDTHQQVSGFAGSCYKGFATREEAEEWFAERMTNFALTADSEQRQEREETCKGDDSGDYDRFQPSHDACVDNKVEETAGIDEGDRHAEDVKITKCKQSACVTDNNNEETAGMEEEDRHADDVKITKCKQRACVDDKEEEAVQLETGIGHAEDVQVTNGKEATKGRHGRHGSVKYSLMMEGNSDSLKITSWVESGREEEVEENESEMSNKTNTDSEEILTIEDSILEKPSPNMSDGIDESEMSNKTNTGSEEILIIEDSILEKPSPNMSDGIDENTPHVLSNTIPGDTKETATVTGENDTPKNGNESTFSAVELPATVPKEQTQDKQTQDSSHTSAASQTSHGDIIKGTSAEETIADIHSELTSWVQSEYRQNEDLKKALYENEIQSLKHALSEKHDQLNDARKALEKAQKERDQQDKNNKETEDTQKKMFKMLQRLEMKQEGERKELQVITKVRDESTKATNKGRDVNVHDMSPEEIVEMKKKIKDLESKLTECQNTGEFLTAHNKSLQELVAEKQNDIVTFQQKVVSSNQTILSLQQQLIDKNLMTTQQFNDLNQQIFDFVNVNTSEWRTPRGRNKTLINTRPEEKENESGIPTHNSYHILTDEHTESSAASTYNASNGAKRKASSGMKTSTRGKRFFKGAHDKLSNFYPCRFRYNGVEYNCAEQAFQAAKASHHGCFGIRSTIMSSEDPKMMKQLGRDIRPLDQEWEKKEVKIMENILNAKFQIGKFRDALKDSNEDTLLHNVVDTFWGSGPEGNGQNWMGQILTKMRSQLPVTQMRSQLPDYTSEPRDSVLIVGHSHLNHFDPNKVGGLRVTAESAHTIQEARMLLEAKPSLPRQTIIHLITNDAKTEDVDTCVENLTSLVTDLETAKKTEVKISLPPPVLDRGLNDKIARINAKVLNLFGSKCIEHKQSFCEREEPLTSWYARDGIHLSSKGMSRLVKNFKDAVMYHRK